MTLADLLAPARVRVPLAAASLQEAIGELLDALAADGVLADPAAAAADARERWPEDVLRFGEHAVLPHFRTDAATRLGVALGVAPAPLAAEGRAGRGARIVLLVLAPPRDSARYLQVVAAFARLLGRSGTVAALLAAPDAAAALAVPDLADFRLAAQLLVRDIMTVPARSIPPDMRLADAADLLVRWNVEALPVVGAEGEVLGLLSNRELLRFLVPAYVQRVNTGEFRAARPGAKAPPDPRDLPVREAMARSVLCVGEEQPVADVAQLVLTRDVDRFPVVRNGVLTGFLTRADIVRKVLGHG